MAEITGWRRLLNEPARLATAIRAIIFAAMAFGLNITINQLALTMAALELVLMEVQRALVVPIQLAEARVAAGLPPTMPMDKP